jgi:uncharacterized repeat protein (TIGR01451 family)
LSSVRRTARTPASLVSPAASGPGVANAEAVVAPQSGAKLTVKKTGPRVVNAGKVGRWTITIRNTGTTAARGTIAWDDLPAGFHLVSAKGLKGAKTAVRIEQDSVRFDVGVLKAGGTKRLVIALRVATNHKGGIAYNRARVIARNAKLTRGKVIAIVKPRVSATRIRPAVTG